MHFSHEIRAFIQNTYSLQVELGTKETYLYVKNNGRICCIYCLSIDAFHCADNKVDLFIHEDQWICKPAIIKSKIRYMLGMSDRIHGRQTTVVTLDRPVFQSFLSANHIIGPVNCKYKYGLIKNDVLYGVAGFTKACPVDRNGKQLVSYELSRYCTLNGYAVSGGLDKLVKHFKKLYVPEDIMTSINKEWSQGNSFLALGFRRIAETPPILFYVSESNYERISQYAFESMSESELQTRGPFIKKSNLGNIKLACTVGE